MGTNSGIKLYFNNGCNSKSHNAGSAIVSDGQHIVVGLANSNRSMEDDSKTSTQNDHKWLAQKFNFTWET